MQLNHNTVFDHQALPLYGVSGHQLTVIIKGTFDFDGTPCAAQTPIAFADQPYDDATGDLRYESDIVAFKPNTDVVLVGSALAPEGKPVTDMDVSLKIGPIEKRLKIFGERLWNHAGLLSRRYKITAAKPFTTLPLRYKDAFGGIDPLTSAYCEHNLSGKGYYAKKTKADPVGKPLPCIEDPAHLIRNIKDHPMTAGFGFFHRAWQPRAGFAGTYDEQWRQLRSPLPPVNFDPRYNNSAHPDLQVDGYLTGNEPVELLNLTPQGATRFSLPGITPLCAIQKTPGAQAVTLPAALDTVFIDTDNGLFNLVWRAGLPIDQPDAADTAVITVRIQSNKGR